MDSYVELYPAQAGWGHPPHLDGRAGQEKGQLLHYGDVRRPGDRMVSGSAPHQAPRRYRRLSRVPFRLVCLKDFRVGATTARRLPVSGARL